MYANDAGFPPIHGVSRAAIDTVGVVTMQNADLAALSSTTILASMRE